MNNRTRNIFFAIMAVALIVCAYLLWQNHREKNANTTSQNICADSINRMDLIQQINLQNDTLTAIKAALANCRQGRNPLVYIVPKYRVCGLKDLSLKLLNAYSRLQQDSIRSLDQALIDCSFGRYNYRQVIVNPQPRLRHRNPCPPCPSCPPLSPPIVTPPKPIVTPPPVDDGIDPALKALLRGNQPPSSNTGIPVDVGKYKGRREGPFCTTISKDGYTEFCISDQVFRLCNPTIGAPKQGSANGQEYHLESDGYWVCDDRNKGVLTMDNLFSQTLKWCVYLGENSDWKYPMYFPHELVKLPNGLTEFREKSSPPAVWPNGIKYGDDTSTPDKSQGWNCVTSIIYTEVR